MRINSAFRNKIAEQIISTLFSGNYFNGHGAQAGFEFRGGHRDLTTSSWMRLWLD
jgi:hypothetical protein